MATPLRLGLAQRGILLLAAPLVFQLVLLAGLYRLNAEAEAAAIKAKGAADVIQNIHELVGDILQTSRLLENHALSKPGFDVDEYKQRMDRLEVRANDLLNNKVNGKQRNSLVEFVDFLHKLKGKLQQLLLIYQTHPEDVEPFARQLKQDMRMYYSTTGVNALSEMMEENRAIVDAAPKLQAANRAKTETVIAVLALTDISITLLIAFLFARNIASRVMRLSTNSERVSAGEDLLPVMQGSDEIAEVDKSFHAMADRLAEAERARRALLAMFTHDLKSPLAHILLTLESVEAKSVQTDPQTTEAVGTAYRSGQRMMSLMNDLLEFDKLRTGEMPLNVVDLGVRDILLEAVQLSARIAEEKKITVKVGSAKADLEVPGDYDRLLQVLLNLISNAIKYSPEQTVVLVDAFDREHLVEFLVTDQGRGVPSDKGLTIFDPYVQTQESDFKLGHGLGLAICKSLVERHGGSIGFKNNPEGGCTFFFTLPKEHEQVPA